MLDAQSGHPVADDARTAPGDDAALDADFPQRLEAETIFGVKGLELFAVVAHVDATIREHAIDIADQQPDLLEPFEQGDVHGPIEGFDHGHQTTPALSTSCMLKAPTGRFCLSTTTSPLIFLVCINCTASAASISGPTVMQPLFITASMAVWWISI